MMITRHNRRMGNSAIWILPTGGKKGLERATCQASCPTPGAHNQPVRRTPPIVTLVKLLFAQPHLRARRISNVRDLTRLRLNGQGWWSRILQLLPLGARARSRTKFLLQKPSQRINPV